tara:strand:- start:11 stop:439 length:429 start_codon:yes stop_codon:yes gene_type:complete
MALILFFLSGIIGAGNLPFQKDILLIISIIGFFYSLIFQTPIPNDYLWGLVIIYFLKSYPPLINLGIRFSNVLIGKDPKIPQDIQGGTLVWSLMGFVWSLFWLSYASSTDGTWYIYLIWFICSSDMWGFLQIGALHHFLKNK